MADKPVKPAVGAPPAPAKSAAPAPVKRKPFAKPVMMDNPDPIHCALLREIVDPSTDDDLKTSGVLATFNKLVEGIVNGGELESSKNDVIRLISNPTEKAQVVLGMLLNADIERLGMFVNMRSRTEQMLNRAMQRSDLSCAEALAFNRMACIEIGMIRANLEAEQPVVDTTTLTEKIDSGKHQVERKIERTLQRTSPQGREIIRRRIYAMTKGQVIDAPTTPVNGK